LAGDGALLSGTARRDLDAAVPPCPGWAVRDVLTHTAEVYEHKLACIALGAAPKPWPPQWPADRDPLDWYADAHHRLLDVLTSTDPATPAYSWWPPDQTVGFWVRRMAQETAVHRVDVQSAFDAVTPIDDELATDGVDEVLVVMLSGDWAEAPVDPAAVGKRIEVATGGRSWLVGFAAEDIEVSAADGPQSAGGAGSVDAGVQGAPSSVLLWLWGRAADDEVTVSGDVEVVRQLRHRLAMAT